MFDRFSILLAVAAVSFGVARAAPGPVALQPFASGITLPVDIVNAGDSSGRLFVVEKPGRIRIVKNGQVLATPFLDISGPVVDAGEEGLLGLAFHPAYASNGRFYVFHNQQEAGPATGGSDIVVARYTRSAANPDVADPNSRQVVITIPHPVNSNHNGGKIAFGRDGYLYIALGDGGGGGDPFLAGQNRNDLRGKILRLDVDSASPYAIPPANPFVGQPGMRGEIFAYGLRNPWRFSVDRANGDIFIGDVGQGEREEVDLVPFGTSGQNFGWSVFEGTRCYNPPTGCSLAGHTLPILEYAHDANGGISITGGFRYRGGLAELWGYYVYGDYGSGRVWAASPGPGGAWTTTQIASIANVTTFGEDEAGELYGADIAAGILYRFRPVDADGDGMSDLFETQYFGSATAGDAAADSDGDGIPNAVEYAERRNPIVKDNDVFSDARLFAMQQYRDFLGREGEPAGLAVYTNLVAGGGATRAQVIEAFFGSPEFEGLTAPVTRLYFAFFNRIPDYPGLMFQVARLRAGQPIGAIANDFALSPEFQATYGALTDAQYVALLYQNVLGRTASQGEIDFHVARLAGGASRGVVMAGFSESPEYVANVAHAVSATMLYAGMLRRVPEQAGFDYWVAYLDGGNPRLALILGFLNAPEYRARFLPAP